MTFGDIVTGIADLIQPTFELLAMAGNGPNVVFILIGFVLLFIWLKQMGTYKKIAKRDGTHE